LDQAWVHDHVPPPAPYPFFQPAGIRPASASQGATQQVPYVSGQLNTTFVTVGTETDVPQLIWTSDAEIHDGTANNWSVQNNTNGFIGSNNHADWVQFGIQAINGDGYICIYNWDNTLGDDSASICTSGWDSTVGIPLFGVPVPLRNQGRLQAFDFVNIAGYTDNSDPANPLIKMVVELSSVQDEEHSQYAIVGPDTYGLGGRWYDLNGGVFGAGGGSSAEFTNAEVWTQLAASSCQGNTGSAVDPCPASPGLQGNVSFDIYYSLTAENTNLAYVCAPSANVFTPSQTTGNNLNEIFPNPHYAAATYILSTSSTAGCTAPSAGGCVAPSHVFVRDHDNDHGATPSTLGGAVFYESPDIFLVPHGSPVDLDAVSTEQLVTEGELYDFYVRVNNEFGCNQVAGAQALVYVADPTLSLTPWEQGKVTNGEYWGDSTQKTGGSVTVPAGGKALLGPFTWPAPASGSPHKCILAAIKATGEPAPADVTDAPGSNQVAQRNVQLANCEYGLTNATTAPASVQLSFTVTPDTVKLDLAGPIDNVSVSVDDADSSWYNVWSSQQQADAGAGDGGSFVVSHVGDRTIVRMGTHSVVLEKVWLAAGESRTVLTVPTAENVTSNDVQAKLEVDSVVTYTRDAATQGVANGGACQFTATGTIYYP
jgi:hypothetical protein